ncbi:DUF6959 family protein [Streptomyces mirabilis]
MERVEAELFTDGGNDVVRLQGCNLPGVLIQADTCGLGWLLEFRRR